MSDSFSGELWQGVVLPCVLAGVRGQHGRIGFGAVLALGCPGMPAAAMGMLAGIPVLAKALMSS